MPPDSRPPNGFLGFFKAAIGFFTSVPGMITAALGIIATILAVTLTQETTEVQRETADDRSSITARRTWVSAVDALCEDFDNRAGSWPSQPRQEGRWADNAATVLAEDANRLASMKTPAKYRADAADLVHLWRQGADLLRQAARAAQASDASTYNRRRHDILAVFSESRRTLVPYGARHCTG